MQTGIEGKDQGCADVDGRQLGKQDKLQELSELLREVQPDHVGLPS